MNTSTAINKSQTCCNTFVTSILNSRVKKQMLLFLTFLVFSVLSYSQNVLFEETFNEADRGAIGLSSGPPATLVNPSNGQWTITGNLSSFLNENDYFKTINGELRARDVNSEACFETSIINIAGEDNVTFSIDISESGPNESGDYRDVEYRIDGGSWTMIPNWNGQGDASHTLNDDHLINPLILLMEIANANGEILSITELNNDVFVNNARFVVTDIELDNGTVHIIDAVISRPEQLEIIDCFRFATLWLRVAGGGI